jgi:NAD-dependent dihydropyrimidine dehydrogenase PreA subunit/flavodoxin
MSLRILILFESCTGNTELAAELVRRTLEKDGHACDMRRYRETPTDELEGYDLYCFAAPIQSFAPLIPVHKYIEAMPDLPGKPAFVLTTGGGWAGMAHRMMTRSLHKHGLTVLGTRMLICPDSWPIGRIVDRFVYDHITFPTRHALRGTRAFTLEMVNRAYRQRDGLAVKQAPRFYWPSLSLPLGFLALRGGLARGYGTRTVDIDACSRCRTCVDTCPVGAVALDPYPVFSEDCIGCWGCFNNCPYSAILSTACETRHYYRGIRDHEKLLKKVGL